MPDPIPVMPNISLAIEALRRQGYERITREMVDEWLSKHEVAGVPNISEEEAQLVAIGQLRAEGNRWPDCREVLARMEANREARSRQALAEAQTRELEAKEVRQATLKEPSLPAPKPKRPKGRPQKAPGWLALVAELFAGGLPLRKALWKYGPNLSQSDRRNIYRLTRFKELVAYYRQKPQTP